MTPEPEMVPVRMCRTCNGDTCPNCTNGWVEGHYAPGTPVIVTGDRHWDGSIWRGHTGTTLPPAPGLPTEWVNVRLDNPPATTPNRTLAFRASTLKELR